MDSSSGSVSSQLEGLSDEDLQFMLGNALAVPAHHPRVAEWLFGVQEEDPTATTTISPASFDSALSIESKTRCIPSEEVAPHSGKDCADDDLENVTKSFIVFVPVEEKDGVALGYTFHIGVPMKQSLFPVRDVLRSTFAMIGRFAFDKSRREILIYIRDMTPTTSSLCCFKGLDESRKEVSFFSLPDHDFDGHHLPSRCVGVTTYRGKFSPSQGEPAGCEPKTAFAAPYENHVATNFDSMIGETPADPVIHENPVGSFIDGNPASAIHASGMLSDEPMTQFDTHLLDAFDCLESKNVGDYGLQIDSCRYACDPLEKQDDNEGMSQSDSDGSVSLGMDLDGPLIPLETKRPGSPTDCILGLRFSMLGDTSYSVKRFMGRSSLGQRDAPVEVHMHSGTKETGAKEGEILRMFAARTYYALTLSVTTDLRLTEKHVDESYGDAHKKRKDDSLGSKEGHQMSQMSSESDLFTERVKDLYSLDF